MSSSDGFATKEAKELHGYMLQSGQLRAIASQGVGTLAEHIIKALGEAADSIETLALKSSSPDKQNTD